MALNLDLGIDLGTSTVVIYGKGKGVLLNEPAVIALDKESKSVLAVGEEARKMIGRTPSNIDANRPLKDGMVADHEMASAMLRYFVMKVSGKRIFGGPHVVMAVPAGVNDNEQHRLISSLYDAGARKTQILAAPVAAAIGAGVKMAETRGTMICDIGGGVTEISVLSQGKTVLREMLKIGGDMFDEAIQQYIQHKHNLMIGPVTAEELKKGIGSVIPRESQFYMQVCGRNLLTGLPREIEITSDEITDAMDEPLQNLLEGIHNVTQKAPSELVSDIYDNGIVLTGGGALLSGMPEAISMALKLRCRMAENPQEAIANGCAMMLENWGLYGQYMDSRRRR